jgi:hypothetical protein
MGRSRTTVLHDLSDLHAPGSVIIDGDWREVHSPWAQLRQSLAEGLLAILGLVFATAMSLLFLSSFAVLVAAIVLLMHLG